jgi:type I restriction enzyme, S subunit
MGSAGLSGYHDEATVRGPGLVLGRSGASFGKVHYCEEDYWPLNTALFATDFLGNDPRFVYFVLKTIQFSAFNSGSAQPSLNRNFIANIPTAIPPIAEQRRIVQLLGGLDDRIDSNRRLAALLEETAATVFRARFVDFVGVEEFDNSDIGRVPRGWRTGALTDLASFVNGKAFTKDANGRGRPILRIRELNSGVDDNTLRADLDAADEYVARDRDILFAWSGSLGVCRWSGPESLINQHIFKVIPESYPPWFVYQWICRHMVEFQAIASEKATTMGHIQRRHLSEAVLPVPQDRDIASVADTIDPIDEHQGILDAETRTLTSLRDALLPKLISGEIQVPDTHDPEELIGPAAEGLAAATS